MLFLVLSSFQKKSSENSNYFDRVKGSISEKRHFLTTAGPFVLHERENE